MSRGANRSRLAAVALIGMALAAAAPASELDGHLWQHRLLVLIAPEATTVPVEAQLDALSRRTEALTDRDLRLYQLYENGEGRYQGQPLSPEQVRRLRATVQARPGEQALLLIGKDGGIKRRSPLPVAPGEIFSQIDAMPMRRAEMRRKRSSGGTVTTP